MHAASTIALRLRYLPFVLTSVGGIALSLTIFAAMRNWEWRHIETAFVDASRSRALAIEEAIQENCRILDAVQTFYAVSGDLTRGQFHKFVKPFCSRITGLQAVMWAPRVAAGDRPALETAAKRDGLAAFSFLDCNAAGDLSPAKQRGEYYPCYFIESQQDLSAIFGLDILSNDERRGLCEKARDSGQAVAAVRTSIVRSLRSQMQLLIFLPVYRPDSPVEVVEQRRHNIQGLIVGAFRLTELVEEVLAGFSSETIDIQFFDTAASQRPTLVFSYASSPKAASGNRAADPGRTAYNASTGPSDANLRYAKDLPAAMGSGRLVFTARQEFVDQRRTWQSWFIFAGCLAISFFGNAALFINTHRAVQNERIIQQRVDELQQSEQRYRLLVENIDLGISLNTADYSIIAVNTAQTYMLRGSAEEFIGKKCYREFERREAPCDHCPGTIAMATKRPAEAETVGRRSDGTEFPVRVRAFPLDGKDGAAAGFIEVVEDITERKRAETAMKQYALALETANRTLEECSVAATAATRAKSEFLANMSHEIRTPLTAILGYAEVLLGLAENVEQNQAATIIQRNGEYLLAVINDILDLSRIEAGKLTVERLRCSPRQILAELVSLMKVNADAKGLPLMVECEGPIPDTIVSDPIRLRQILLNLIGNAVKFTETGVVKIVLRLLNPSSEQPRLQFEVIDSGIGMTEQQIQRLFQPFSQADNSTTRRFGGSGLGLLISQRLAAMLGGGITVDSRPGHGSTFRLAIATGPLHGDPLAAQPATTSTRVANAPATSPDIAIHGRILLVDDGLDNQRLFSHLLRKAGAEVVVADNGRQAVDRAIAARDNTPFDLILMDIQMPDMDGYEATRQLRKNGYRGPILAVTAHAMPQDVQQCLAAGCDAHLSKPIDKASLLNAVAQALASQRDSETGSPR